MTICEKIKWRLGLYKGLIEKRSEIKGLYQSFDEIGKRDFRSILKSRLIRSFKLYLLSKNPRPKYNFYSPRDNALVFQNYIFKSPIITQNSQKIIQEISFLIEEILIKKVYEEGGVRIRPRDVVLDCGANIGVFSIYAAKRSKMVYAFEPSEMEIATLYENKRINRSDNIKIVPRAVIDTAKNAKLILDGTGSHFLVSEDNKEGNKDEKAIDVKTISIDEFVKEKNLKTVDFIKMDIEGSEGKALLGARETLKSFRPKLAICAYHKPRDFYELPLLIKNINRDYKIRLKNKNGTLVCYAI